MSLSAVGDWCYGRQSVHTPPSVDLEACWFALHHGTDITFNDAGIEKHLNIANVIQYNCKYVAYVIMWRGDADKDKVYTPTESSIILISARSLSSVIT